MFAIAVSGPCDRAQAEMCPNILIILVDDWKLINQPGSGGFSKPARIQLESGGPEGQLYNLQDHPAETKNLYLQHPEIVTRLNAEMQNVETTGHRQ
jgi:arylsulfatase A-like enzyme